MRLDIQRRTVAKRPVNQKRKQEIENGWNGTDISGGHDRGGATKFEALHLEIVNAYCGHFGLKRQDLLRDSFRTSGREKVRKGVSIATMRMALGYYFEAYLGQNLTYISKLIGYASHSTMSQNRKRIEWYIQNEDEKFLPYFKTLSDIADKYQNVLI